MATARIYCLKAGRQLGLKNENLEPEQNISSCSDWSTVVHSTLIGRAPKLLRSHWSRASLVLLALVFLFHET